MPLPGSAKTDTDLTSESASCRGELAQASVQLRAPVSAPAATPDQSDTDAESASIPDVSANGVLAGAVWVVIAAHGAAALGAQLDALQSVGDAREIETDPRGATTVARGLGRAVVELVEGRVKPIAVRLANVDVVDAEDFTGMAHIIFAGTIRIGVEGITVDEAATSGASADGQVDRASGDISGLESTAHHGPRVGLGTLAGLVPGRGGVTEGLTPKAVISEEAHQMIAALHQITTFLTYSGAG